MSTALTVPTALMRWSLAVAREHVAAGGADAERADAFRVDFAARGEERDGGLDVLDAVGWILQPAGLAAALALVGRVVGERDEALVRQAPSVEAGGLLLDAAARVADDERRTWTVCRTVGNVEVAGERDAGAVE